MEIKKFYKEMNEVQDISNDFVEIKMSLDDFTTLKVILETCEVRLVELNNRKKAILKALNEGNKKAEVNWY